MTSADLTPKPYLCRYRSRRVIRCWAVAASCCLLLAMGSILVNSSRRPDSSASLAREEIAQAQARIVQNEAISKQMALQLKQSERELQASSYLIKRPDWSAVLTNIAAQFQGKVVMTGFRLGSMSDTKVRAGLGDLAADVPKDSVWLVLTGVGEANSDVSALIFRLEALGLFEQVVMTGTQREAFAGAARTGFVLACRVQ